MSFSTSLQKTEQENYDSRIAAAENALAGRTEGGSTLTQIGAGSDVVNLAAIRAVEDSVARQASAQSAAYNQQVGLFESSIQEIKDLAETRLTDGENKTNKVLLYAGGGVLALVAIGMFRKS